MPLHELQSNDYYTFTQKLRETGDDPYLQHKAMKDRQKLRELINGLLKEKEVIIFYKTDGVEKMIIGTLKKRVEKEYWPPLDEVPKSLVSINDQLVPQEHHVAFWEYPIRESRLLHLDTITKILVHNQGLDANWFRQLKDANR